MSITTRPIKVGETHEIYEIKDNGSITYLDLETGELIFKGTYDPEKEYVQSKKALEALEKYAEKLRNRTRDIRGTWVNVPVKTNQELVLSLTERAFVIFLSLYVNYDDLLVKNGKALRNKDIAELWEVYNKNGEKSTISLKKISEKLSELVDKNVLIRVPDEKDKRYSNYRFNKMYLYQGEQISHEKFVKVYQKKLTEVIDKLKKIEQRKNQNRKKSKIDIIPVIGLLHAVMPYVHIQSGYLVKNPDFEFLLKDGETIGLAILKNPSALKKLPKSIIARALGYKEMNRSTLDAYFKILADAGALKIDDTEGVKMILMHPDLMYRQDTGSKAHLDELRGKFGLHAAQNKDEE